MRKTRFLTGILALLFVIGMVFVAEASQTLQRPQQRYEWEWEKFFSEATEATVRAELRAGLSAERILSGLRHAVNHNHNTGVVAALLEAGANPTLGRGLTSMRVFGGDGGNIPLYQDPVVENALEGTEALRLLQQRYREMSR